MEKFSEFVRLYEMTGMSPLQIVCEYLVQTNQEEVALELIPKLAKSQTEKVKKQLDYARCWIPNKVDTYACNKGITKEQSKMLDVLTDYYCLGMDIPENFLPKVKETVEQMKTPTLVFVPMVDWLKDKYGIEFMDKVRGNKINNSCEKDIIETANTPGTPSYTGKV